MKQGLRTAFRPLFTVAACALVCTLSSKPAYAHSDDYFDSHPSAHGGQTRMAGPIHIELTAAGPHVMLYITDHAGKPQATAGGKAALRVGEAGPRIELSPSGENTFMAMLESPIPDDAVLIVMVQLANAEAQTARFDKKTAGAAPEHHHHDAK